MKLKLQTCVLFVVSSATLLAFLSWSQSKATQNASHAQFGIVRVLPNPETQALLKRITELEKTIIQLQQQPQQQPQQAESHSPSPKLPSSSRRPASSTPPSPPSPPSPPPATTRPTTTTPRATTTSATSLLEPQGRCYVSGYFGGKLIDELWRLRILAQSLLMTGSNVPLLVLVPSERPLTDFDFLTEQQNIRLFPVTLWNITGSLKDGFNSRHYIAFHKLQAFIIPDTLCTKMTFLDSDILALKNPDKMFEASHVTCSSDYPQLPEGDICFREDRWMNNGAFVFHQDPEFISMILEKVNRHDASLDTSQGEMSKYYVGKWKHLDFDIVAYPHTCRCGDARSSATNWHLVHFTWGSIKPHDLWRDAQYDPDRYQVSRPISCYGFPCDCSVAVYDQFLRVARSVTTRLPRFQGPLKLSNRNCYVTGLFQNNPRPEDTWALRVMIRSLRQAGATQALHIMVPDNNNNNNNKDNANHELDVLDIAHRESGVHVRRVKLWDTFSLAPAIAAQILRFQAMEVFEPNECERMVWVDPHSLVLQNTDAMFNISSFISSAVDYRLTSDVSKDPRCGFRNTPSLNVMVFQKDEKFLEFVHSRLKAVELSPGVSTDFRNLIPEYYKQDRLWRRLPYTHGAFPFSCLCTAESWALPEEWSLVYFPPNAVVRPSQLWIASEYDASRISMPANPCTSVHCPCATPLYNTWINIAEDLALSDASAGDGGVNSAKRVTSSGGGDDEDKAQTTTITATTQQQSHSQQHQQQQQLAGMTMSKPHKRCYITGLFGGNFDREMWRVRVLAESLQQSGSSIPLVVMVPDSEPAVRFDFLAAQSNIRLVNITLWDLSGSLKTSNKRHALAFHKLQAFEDIPEGVCSGRMVFVDTDVLVMNNPDLLFGKPHLSASVDYDHPGSNTVCGFRNRMNNGLFVFERDPDFIQFVKRRLALRNGNTGTSQQVMDEYYADSWTRLDYRAGAFPHSCRCSSMDWASPTAWYMVHFTWSCAKPGDIWISSRFSRQASLEKLPKNICEYNECQCARPVYEKWFQLAETVFEKEIARLGSANSSSVMLSEVNGVDDGGIFGDCGDASGEAFVTLASLPDWVPAVEVLTYSLARVHSARPLIVLVPRDELGASQLSENDLQRIARVGGKVCFVPHIKNPSKLGQHAARRDCYNKLHPFRLPLTTAVFLDADTLVLHNVDELFQALPQPTEASSSAATSSSPYRIIAGVPEAKHAFFNSGVFVYRPNKAIFDEMLSNVGELSSWDSGDQGFFDSFFFGSKGNREEKGLVVLNGTYNFRRSMRMLTQEWVMTWYPNKTFQKLEQCFDTANKGNPECNVWFNEDIEKHLDEIKIVHYVSDQKPWKNPMTSLDAPNPVYGKNVFFNFPALDQQWVKISEEMKQMLQTQTSNEHNN